MRGEGTALTVRELRSGSHPSNHLRINPVIFSMRPEKSDHQDTRPVLHSRDQSVVVALDVEHHAAGLEDALAKISLPSNSLEGREGLTNEKI
jgi:hypothetical protein